MVRWPRMLPVAFALLTSVVAIRTPEQTVVAADSRTVFTSDTAQAVQTCKIAVLRDTAVVVAGLALDPTHGEPLDLMGAARNYLQGFEPLSERVEKLDEVAIRQLRTALSNTRERYPDWFRREIESSGRPLAQVLVVALAPNAEQVLVRSYRHEVRLDGKLDVRADALPVADEGATFLGQSEAMARIGAQAAARMRTAPVDVAREMVQAEIDERPQSVGPPVRIGAVVNGRWAWVEGGEGCP